ncbi:hypothetical protein BDR04DRAFT_1118472 [Suillus decipiens]|nr:hypothetical protein BDR04DRAFT_1118472 [Suillus decipiens]
MVSRPSSKLMGALGDTYVVYNPFREYVKEGTVMPMRYITSTVQTIKQSIQTIEQSSKLMGALGDTYAACTVWVTTNWSFTDPTYILAEGILKDYPNLNMSLHYRNNELNSTTIKLREIEGTMSPTVQTIKLRSMMKFEIESEDQVDVRTDDKKDQELETGN